MFTNKFEESVSLVYQIIYSSETYVLPYPRSSIQENLVGSVLLRITNHL
jgi:hypothetical protein